MDTSRPHWYGLDGEPISSDEAEQLLADARARRIAHTVVGDATVSTVFLVLDHGFEGPPVLWETMVFGGDHDGEQWRYRTRDAALAGHDEFVALVWATG